MGRYPWAGEAEWFADIVSSSKLSRPWFNTTRLCSRFLEALLLDRALAIAKLLSLLSARILGLFTLSLESYFSFSFTASYNWHTSAKSINA